MGGTLDGTVTSDGLCYTTLSTEAGVPGDPAGGMLSHSTCW